jgi:hypothetical protein
MGFYNIWRKFQNKELDKDALTDIRCSNKLKKMRMV